ncbi:MAG: GAF domain-containing protein [Anaerolineae bacterium]|nr:GAF domain-containing protein [Anaerolineae bacterium]MDW8298172.1 GAF domain-containing protein [Anaerolineae bacterium]
MSLINVLVATQAASMARYRENLAKEPSLKVTYATSLESAHEMLRDSSKHFDVFVADNALGDTYDLIRVVRLEKPRLLILTVDEEADFSMPGRADDVSNTPFKDNELIRKIKRLAEERRLETVRADALPPIRNFAKALAKATKGLSKHQAAVSTIMDLGYDHVAFYAVEQGRDSLVLTAQMGDNAVMNAMPQRADANSLVGIVARTGKSQIAARGSTPSHFLLEKGRFGTAAAVSVGQAIRFGVVLAFREPPESISQEHVIMLELICAQLASSLAKDQRE